MSRKLYAIFTRLPIKWKLVVSSTFLLFILFAAYNLAQFFVINQWMIKREKAELQSNMTELLNYYQDPNIRTDAESLKKNQFFLKKMNEKHQLIRIIDEQGHTVVAVSNHLNGSGVRTQNVKESKLESIWNQDHLLVLRSPLITKQFRGTIEMIYNPEIFDQLSDLTLLVMVIGGFIGMLLSATGGLLLAKQLLLPIQYLTETIKNVKHKGLHERVKQFSNRDELSNLANIFNEMLDQLEQSFEKQIQFVEDASHELRTPVSIIEGHLKLLDRWGKKEPAVLEESLSAALQEIDRLKGIVQELLQLTRAEAPSTSDYEQIHLYEIVSGTAKSFSVLHPDFEFKTELEEIAGTQINISSQHLEQILLILLDNAVKYSHTRKFISVKAIRFKEKVQLEVSDHGMGIPEDNLPFVFDRFYRVDKARSRERGGTGLGLAIAKRLVERYGGRITLSSLENQGTTVTIILPVV